MKKTALIVVGILLANTLVFGATTKSTKPVETSTKSIKAPEKVKTLKSEEVTTKIAKPVEDSTPKIVSSPNQATKTSNSESAFNLDAESKLKIYNSSVKDSKMLIDFVLSEGDLSFNSIKGFTLGYGVDYYMQDKLSGFNLKLKPRYEVALSSEMKLGGEFKFGLYSSSIDGKANEGGSNPEATYGSMANSPGSGSGMLIALRPYGEYTTGAMTIKGEIQYSTFTAKASGSKAETSIRIKPGMDYKISPQFIAGGDLNYQMNSYDGKDSGNSMTIRPWCDYAITSEFLVGGEFMFVSGTIKNGGGKINTTIPPTDNTPIDTNPIDWTLSPAPAAGGAGSDATFSGTIIRPYVKYNKAISSNLTFTAEGSYSIGSSEVGDSLLTLSGGVKYFF